MQNHEFFTRLIAVNCAGPNMQPDCSSGDAPEKVFVCDAFGEDHENFSEAEDCCRPVVFTQYICPGCKERHDEAEDALQCCGVTFAPMRCPVCLKSAGSFESATDCCLFLHPSMTPKGRALTAEMVSTGTPWPDAVAANIHN